MILNAVTVKFFKFIIPVRNIFSWYSIGMHFFTVDFTAPTNPSQLSGVEGTKLITSSISMENFYQSAFWKFHRGLGKDRIIGIGIPTLYLIRRCLISYWNCVRSFPGPVMWRGWFWDFWAEKQKSGSEVSSTLQIWMFQSVAWNIRRDSFHLSTLSVFGHFTVRIAG